MFTEEDVAELDRILSRCESIGFDNTERIFGRLAFVNFSLRFTEDELDQMSKKIGATRRKF